MRRFRRNWFYMSRSDRRAFLVVCLLLLIAMGFLLYRRSYPDEVQTVALTEEERACFEAFENSLQRDSADASGRRESYYAVPEKVPETFSFDPNTVDSTQMLRLGLSPWQVRSIYRYRAKGGRFHQASDFAKVYGMTGEVYDRLAPCIRIARPYRLLRDTASQVVEREDSFPKYPVKIGRGSRVNLNLADTVLLCRIPGIGKGYARRIIAYREALGGFVALNQLAEIEDFPAEATDWFILTKTPIRRMNVNHLPVERLRRHPYLNFYQSKVIVEHRRKFGPLSSLHDLSLYEEFTENDLLRLEPYVAFD